MEQEAAAPPSSAQRDRGPSSAQTEAAILSTLKDLAPSTDSRSSTDLMRMAITSPAASKRIFASGGLRGGVRGGRGAFRQGYGSPSPAQVDPRLSQSLGPPDEDFDVRDARGSPGDVEARQDRRSAESGAKNDGSHGEINFSVRNSEAGDGEINSSASPVSPKGRDTQ